MITVLLWVLAVGLIVLCRWSDEHLPRRRRKRTEDGDFWLWEHEPTREVTRE